jgi:XRE family transcriptional regulator of biofilm formation
MPIGERIKARRRELGWTQEELARRLGVRQNVISRLEAGVVNNPSVSMIRRLARVLGVTADHLVGMYDEDQDDAGVLETVGASP